MEIIPRGDESRKFVAGTLYIENDGTGAATLNGGGIGHYDYQLSGPVQDGDCAQMDDFWECGRLENFARKRGWWACVKEVLCRAKTDYDPPMGEYDSSNDNLTRR